MTFNALYYTSTFATGTTAKVTLETYRIRIDYTDTEGLVKTTYWNTDHIHKNKFDEPHRVYLTYGTTITENLEFNDRSVIDALKTNYPNAAFHQQGSTSQYRGLVNLFIIGGVVLAALVATYLLAVPALADRMAKTLPRSVEEEMGEASYKSMLAGEKIDEQRTEAINHFFKTLHYNSNYPIRITVVNNNIVNAFALPGGRIVVYTGIIDKMNQPEELVALLSHEYSHVQLQHSTKAMCRSLGSYVILSALVGDAGGVTAAVVQNADQLKQLGYSRSLEEEADREGMKLMEQNRIDLNGMRNLFKALKAEEKDNTTPGFLSTHPLTEDRINVVNAQIQKHTFNPQPHSELNQLFEQIKNGRQSSGY